MGSRRRMHFGAAAVLWSAPVARPVGIGRLRRRTRRCSLAPTTQRIRWRSMGQAGHSRDRTRSAKGHASGAYPWVPLSWAESPAASPTGTNAQLHLSPPLQQPMSSTSRRQAQHVGTTEAMSPGLDLAECSLGSPALDRPQLRAYSHQPSHPDHVTDAHPRDPGRAGGDDLEPALVVRRTARRRPRAHERQ